MTLRNYYDDSRVGANKWIVDNTLYLTKHGSHAYGTNRPDSDLDIRGIAIPPEECLLGLNTFEQLIANGDPDIVIFDIRKFFRLAAECNPNAIEILFTDDSDHLHTPNWFAMELKYLRDKFLSRKAKWTFCGYATGQLKRIETHRRWLLNPPTHKPTREEFGLLPQSMIPHDQMNAALAQIKKREEDWDIDLGVLDEAGRIATIARIETVIAELVATDRTLLAGKSIGYDANFLEILKSERQYKQAAIEWDQYQNWKETRNADRTVLEAKYGYDTKHGMHLVRLLRMAREILSEGEVRVKRPDAKELLDIRDGAWTYERLLAWAVDQQLEITELEKKSPLPKEPPRKELGDALCDMVKTFHGWDAYGRC